MSAEPGLDDPSHVEMVAEKLAEALSQPLQRIERQTPELEDWTWEGIVEGLSVEAVFGDGDKRVEALERVGYEFKPDPDQPGRWLWTAPSYSSETSFDSKALAIQAAWADAVEQTKSIEGLSEEDWNGLTLERQADHVADALLEG